MRALDALAYIPYLVKSLSNCIQSLIQMAFYGIFIGKAVILLHPNALNVKRLL